MRGIVLIAVAALAAATVFADETTVVRMVRTYGGTDERMPPVVMISNRSTQTTSTIGAEFVTVEFDVQSTTIPNIYARIVHCDAFWNDDENGFVSDITMRTSLADWTLAPQRSRFFSYRGKMRFPNEQVNVRFSGNWKVRIYDMDGDRLLTETRFFAVDESASMRMNFMTDFYEPRYRVSTTALTLEALVSADPSRLLDGMLHTVVIYRNSRWNEPFTITTKAADVANPPSSSTSVGGVLYGGKVFRISRIPAENEYRILDLSNTARFPSTGQPIRLPLSDLRRNGNFFQRANDGVMVTSMISSSDDEYVPIEFLLDPTPGGPSAEDVFVVGSFNSWKPDRSWQMSWSDELRLYRLRQWVRRGSHDYLYGTGRVNADNGEIVNLSFEEFEGNTASAGHGFLALAYYRVLDYGGYDGIVAVTTSNIYTGYR